MKIYNYQTKQQPPAAASKKTNNWRRRFENLPWAKIGTWSFRISAAGILILAFLFIYYSRHLPDPNRLLGRNVPESTKIYAKDETLLYEVHGEIKRTLVNLDDISPDLKNATIAVEDKNFYRHAGISITGLGRSIIVDIIHGEKRQGGSTITQQFVKNAMLTREKSFVRKAKEIILSIEMEARFSKNDILKLYLNEIPYGRNAYGIQAASETYFKKNANELTLAESAYLAALPQAPSYYNPSGPNFDNLQARQKFILAQMLDQKYITNEQYESALNENVEFQKISTSIIAPHFVQYVQEYLAEKYGERTLQEGGLKVYTTLDPKLQEIAEKAVKDGAAKNVAGGGYNAALVAIDPKTGQILAMVGSKDYFGESQPAGCTPGKTCVFEPNVNVATTNQQPGSSFKPYAYVTAFTPDHKYAPASMLVDVVTNFGDYTPRNFNLSQNGPVSMRRALAGSLNIPAVKTIALVGADNVVRTARDLGITSQFKDCGLSLVLGGCDVKLVDHTAAYATLANAGRKNEKTAILKVVSQEGNTLEEYKQKDQKVIDEQAVYELTHIMSDNSARSYVFGSNSPLQLGDRPVAAKTGTTQDFRDGWTMGFTPSLAAGVWTGNNNNASMKRDAVLMAGPIWNQFMKEALTGTPIEQFERPSGIQEVRVDALSGLLPTQYTPETKVEIFADYAVPTKYDNIHVPVEIDSSTGLPATNDTPDELRTTTIYRVLHSEKPDNPAWENPVIAWALANGYRYPAGSGITNPAPSPSNDASFAAPNNNALITDLPFSVALNISGENVEGIELSIDGEFVQSITAAPYTTSINKKLEDGPHTLTAKVAYADGRSTTTSVSIRYALENASLELTAPSGSSAEFPLDLAAESSMEFDTVTFYYQRSGQTRTIGRASKSDSGQTYVYTFTWDPPPNPGTYQIYARSSDGTTSNRATIEIE